MIDRMPLIAAPHASDAHSRTPPIHKRTLNCFFAARKIDTCDRSSCSKEPIPTLSAMALKSCQ